MRKLSLLFFSFVVIIFLTSCTGEPAPPAKSFTAQVEAVCNGEKINAELISNNRRLLTVKILSPPAMRGYKYTYKDNLLYIEYKTFNVKAEPSYLSAGAFPSVIYNVLSALNKEENCRLSAADKAVAVYKGSSAGGKFELKSERNTGAIRQIEIKSLNFSAKLKNVSIKSDVL